jgi:hypothetical protein
VGVVSASRCYHKYEFENVLNHRFHAQRNRLTTLLTLEKVGTILLTIPCLAFAELVVGFYLLLNGDGQTPARLVRHFSGRKTWALIRARRREIAILRRCRDADIVGHFAGTVLLSRFSPPALQVLCNSLLQLYWTMVRHLILW